MALRPDFRRIALSIQYHGGSFLGLQKSGPKYENCITNDGTDLRGYRSIASHLETACEKLFGYYENLAFSSRTDRGVHALKNTLHVDIPANKFDSSLDIRRGLNFFLRIQARQLLANSNRPKDNTLFLSDNHYVRLNPNNDVRVLVAKLAPTKLLPDPQNNQLIPWHARFHAVQRVYLYRIFHTCNQSTAAFPFEWDRSWRVDTDTPLDVTAMKEAAAILTGRHDFTSFRASGCQAPSPTVNLKDISISIEPYQSPFGPSDANGLFERNCPDCSIVNLVFTGDKFLYRMVRNLVVVLVQVGSLKLSVPEVRDILNAKDRTSVQNMAPANGLFLVDVRYNSFEI